MKVHKQKILMYSEKGSTAWWKCPSRKSKCFVIIPCSPLFCMNLLVRWADGQVWENRSFLVQSELSEVEQWVSFPGPDHTRINWLLWSTNFRYVVLSNGLIPSKCTVRTKVLHLVVTFSNTITKKTPISIRRFCSRDPKKAVLNII